MAYGKNVWIHIGFGIFNMNNVVNISLCPICKKRTTNVTTIGYYHCKIKIEGKIEGEDNYVFVDEHRGDSDIKSFAQNE